MWTSTENISPFERSPVCWVPLQVAGSSKAVRRRTSQEVTISFFASFFCHPMIVVTIPYFCSFCHNLRILLILSPTDLWSTFQRKPYLKLTFGFWNELTPLSGITRTGKNSGLHHFVSSIEHISRINPLFNFFTVSLHPLICVHFHFHRSTFTFCLFCQLKNISRESHSIFFRTALFSRKVKAKRFD